MCLRCCRNDSRLTRGCGTMHSNQQFTVAAGGTVQSGDGSLCVTYGGASPAQLSMSACVKGAANQVWSFAPDAMRPAFKGQHGPGGACVAWNSQGDPANSVRPLSTWKCTELAWNGFYTPDAGRKIIVAKCSSPWNCGGTHCVTAVPPPPPPCAFGGVYFKSCFLATLLFMLRPS